MIGATYHQRRVNIPVAKQSCHEIADTNVQQQLQQRALYSRLCVCIRHNAEADGPVCAWLVSPEGYAVVWGGCDAQPVGLSVSIPKHVATCQQGVTLGVNLRQGRLLSV
jgi:hypothetical protein